MLDIIKHIRNEYKRFKDLSGLDIRGLWLIQVVLHNLLLMDFGVRHELNEILRAYDRDS